MSSLQADWSEREAQIGWIHTCLFLFPDVTYQVSHHCIRIGEVEELFTYCFAMAIKTQGLGRRVIPNVSLVDSGPRPLSSDPEYWARLSCGCN